MIERVVQTPTAYKELTDDLYGMIVDTLEVSAPQLSNLISPLHPADIADVMERTPQSQRENLLKAIPRDVWGDVLVELDDGVKEHLIHLMQPSEVVEAVADLESDEVVDIVRHLEEEGELPQTVVKLKKEVIDRQENCLLKYDADTAGGLMQLEVLTALPDQKVMDVFKYLRSDSDDIPDNLGTVFVVSKKRKLLGTISLGELVKHKPSSLLRDVMQVQPVKVMPEVAQENVASMFEKYDLHDLAVLNKKGFLLGRITIDDVLDSVLEMHEREVKRAAGLDERDDLFAPVWETTYHRLPWLVINLFTAIAASVVIAVFQGHIEKLVALAVLMPIVASMGGNAGTQTMTVVVRGLAMGQITMKNALNLLGKELVVGGLNGILLAALIALGTVFIYHDVRLAYVFFFATIANHVFAAISGHLIPIMLKKMNYDPAISSGVLVTMVTDVGGFFVFLGLAALLIS